MKPAGLDRPAANTIRMISERRKTPAIRFPATSGSEIDTPTRLCSVPPRGDGYDEAAQPVMNSRNESLPARHPSSRRASPGNLNRPQTMRQLDRGHTELPGALGRAALRKRSNDEARMCRLCAVELEDAGCRSARESDTLRHTGIREQKSETVAKHPIERERSTWSIHSWAPAFLAESGRLEKPESYEAHSARA